MRYFLIAFLVVVGVGCLYITFFSKDSNPPIYDVVFLAKDTIVTTTDTTHNNNSAYTLVFRNMIMVDVDSNNIADLLVYVEPRVLGKIITLRKIFPNRDIIIEGLYWDGSGDRYSCGQRVHLKTNGLNLKETLVL